MSTHTQQQTWDLWLPDVGARGLSFARGRCDATDTLLVHAAPEKLTVEVRDEQGGILARGADLTRTANTPIARLQRQGEQITRADIWPTSAEHGLPVILVGGEIGILQQWWHDEQKQQWRWSIELYNHRER